MAEILLLGNPRRRRKHHRRSSGRRRRMPAALRAYWDRMRGKKANPHRRRKHHRRRAVYRANPHRRRRSHHRHHHYRRNPSFRSLTSGFMGQLHEGAWGAAGGLIKDLLYGYTKGHLPAFLTSGYVLYATNVLYAAVTGVLATMALKGRGRAIGVGAMTVTLHDMAKAILSTTVPSLQLSGGIGEYLTGLGAVSIAPSVGPASSSPLFVRRPLAAVRQNSLGEYLSDANYANGIPVGD